MRFADVRIAAVGHALPDDVVTSEELEARLAPVYDRFRLRVGRLELMSGIRERRFWPAGTSPSTAAAMAGERALESSGVERERIGCLVHASVCRDFLEPATATVVHQRLGLPPTCTVFDLSNACLGVMNGMVVVANMIAQGQIEAGIVVAGEDGRPLVGETIRSVLADDALTKAGFKQAFASLTIGSGAAAVVLARAREPYDEGDKGADQAASNDHTLLGGAVLSATEHNELCRGGHEGGGGPLMSTDSEELLVAGNALAARTFDAFCRELGWTRESIDRVVTHQVGAAHRRLLFETLGLDPARDYPTVQTLGNIGSVSVPLSLSMAVEAGFVQPGHRVAMLGIGSGLNCMMLGLAW